MNRLRVSLFIAAALLAAPRAAWAFGVNGEYVRDDGKTYLFHGDSAILTNPGEWGCRIRGERYGAEMKFQLTFTRTKDEGGLFRTKGKTVGEYWNDTTKVKLEWVELADDGTVKERGEEEHTFKLKRKLTREEDRILGEVIHFHALADAYLEPGTRMYDPAGALDKLLEGNAQFKHPSLEARIKALQAANTGPSKAEKAAAWLESKKTELATLEGAKDPVRLEKLGREAMDGPPGLNSADESCLRLGAEAFSKAHGFAPDNDAIAFEAVAALYWVGSYDESRAILKKVESRNASAKDALGRSVAEWVRGFEAAVAHHERADAASREAEELERKGLKRRAAELRAEADSERAAKSREAAMFVRYFVESAGKSRSD